MFGGAFGSYRAPAAPGGSGEPYSLTPGVRTSLTLSDNLNNRPLGDEAAGYRFEVTPYVDAAINTSRAQGRLGYALTAFYENDDVGSSSNLRHYLNAFGNALLIGDWFGVQGYANNQYVTSDPFGVISADPITSEENTTRYSNWSISPYVLGRAGSFAEYRAQYTLTGSDASGSTSNVLSEQAERVFASISSGPQFARWTWMTYATAERRAYASGVDLDNASARAALYYVFNPELRVGLSANYQYYEGLPTQSGQTSGWGPGISVDWSPSRRTTLRADVVDQYYGTNSLVSFAHRAQRWNFGLNYRRGVTVGNYASIAAIDTAALFSGLGLPAELNPIYQQLLAQGAITNRDGTTAPGIVNDSATFIEFFSASIGYLLPRGSLVFEVFRSYREALYGSTLFIPGFDPITTRSFDRLEQLGAALTYTAPLNARTTFYARGAAIENLDLDTRDKDRAVLLRAGLSTRIDAKTSASVFYRHTRQRTLEGISAEYDENAVIGALNMRF